MLCPGVYPPDPTLGITDPQMLPPPKLVPRSRNYEHRPCPRCGKSCPRDRIFTRTLHDLGDPVGGRPRDIQLTYSQHHCTRCRRFFTADMSDLAAPKARYTHRVVALAVRLVVEDGLPYQAASWHLWRDHRVFVPFATIQNWVEARGKKAADRIGADYLDWALDGFSGYIAADELYDGPFCVLSIVDNRAFKRLCYEVLDHDPTHRDIRRFFRRFRAALTGRGLTLRGITTDGSELYPQPISAGLRRRGASGLSLPYPGGTEQGRPPRRRSGPQAPGRAEAEAPPRAPRHTGGEAEGPAAPAPAIGKSGTCSSIVISS